MNFEQWGQYWIRTLNSGDISQILEISKDIWDGNDYIPGVISHWIEAPNTQMVGIFSPESQEILLGFMRMNWNDSKSVWLEGGRIRASHQKMGLGKVLMEFVLNKSKQQGAQILQYDTSSQSFGSLSLARMYGFNEKTRMRVLYLENPEIIMKFPPMTSPEYISSKKAFQLLNRIKNGPNGEMNLGWAYIPFTEDIIVNQTSRWMANDRAVALIYTNQDHILNREIPDPDGIWLIIYGDDQSVQDLIKQAISVLYTNDVKYFSVFCPESSAEKVEALGFKYYDDKVTSVILFEKKF